MDCKHTLYFNFYSEPKMVSCLKGCGYKSEMRLAMIKHTSSVRLEPVILESVNQQKKTGIMVATQDGYMGVISDYLSGVLYVEKITTNPDLKRLFYDLLYTSLGVNTVQDGTEVVHLCKKN